MIIWVVYDIDTGEELAFHGENGECLRGWRADCERRGHRTAVKQKRIREERAASGGETE